MPFNNSVPRGQQDRGLKYAFVKEKNAIVSKALKYARKLVKNDFEFPTTPQIDCKIDEWKGKTVLSVESFLQNCCDLDSEYRGELMENLYSAYESYCENSSCVSLNRHRFKQYLEKHVGLRHWKMRDGGISSQSAFKGIRIV